MYSDNQIDNHKISSLTAEQRHTQLVEWNATQKDYPKYHCVQTLFEQQVERSPEATALDFAGQQLTYHALNEKANQLAHYLKGSDVGQGSLVGICMDRCVDLIVGFLAILKAGGAYVPLDTSYPQKRLSYMLEDSGAAVLITLKSQVAILPDHYQGITITLDGEDAKEINKQQQQNPFNITSSEHPAYVIYTSGSTGKPKGVIIPHRAINNLVMNTSYINLTVNDRIAQASNISFDAATFEIWGALLNGAQLTLLPKNRLLSIATLDQSLKQQGVTILFITTSLFNQAIDSTPEAFGSLKYLLFGGESVDPLRVKRLLAHNPPKNLLHVYGPTETTTFATCYQLKSVPEEAMTVPIGRPLENINTFLLNKQMEPVPIGACGEIFISGDGLALGYHNSPDLTMERFVPNPFGRQNSRLYKTGDLARYLPDGNIEFIGRLDRQIKLSGFRIELGEIETVIRQHQNVKEALVTLQEETPDKKRLISYCVLHRHSHIDANPIKLFLKQQLPEFMIPNDFVFMESFPLNENGKINRDALPLPGQMRPDLEQDYVEPRSATEKALSIIWTEILEVEKIGIHTNFFDLGGCSLLAMRMVIQISNRFNIQIPINVIFEVPTIAGLSEQIEPMLTLSDKAVDVMIPTLSREDYLVKGSEKDNS